MSINFKLYENPNINILTWKFNSFVHTNLSIEPQKVHIAAGATKFNQIQLFTEFGDESQ